MSLGPSHTLHMMGIASYHNCQKEARLAGFGITAVVVKESVLSYHTPDL